MSILKAVRVTGILECRIKYNVSRTGSVSVLMYRKYDLPFLRMEVEPSSKTLC
jgi:hypothetical protein